MWLSQVPTLTFFLLLPPSFSAFSPQSTPFSLFPLHLLCLSSPPPLPFPLQPPSFSSLLSPYFLDCPPDYVLYLLLQHTRNPIKLEFQFCVLSSQERESLILFQRKIILDFKKEKRKETSIFLSVLNENECFLMLLMWSQYISQAKVEGKGPCSHLSSVGL